MSAEPTIMSAEEWRQPFEEGVRIQLPSGKWVKLRAISIDSLLSEGVIPDVLTSIASRTIWDEIPIDSLGTDYKLGSEFTALINQLIPVAMVEPKVCKLGRAPLSDEIELKHISFADKVAIFQVAIQPTEWLYSFRDKQIGSLEGVPDGEAVREDAEPAPQHPE